MYQDNNMEGNRRTLIYSWNGTCFEKEQQGGPNFLFAKILTVQNSVELFRDWWTVVLNHEDYF